MKLKFWVILIILFLLGVYIFLPVLHFNFIDLPILLIICLVIIILIQLGNIKWTDALTVVKQFIQKLKSVRIVGLLIIVLLAFILLKSVFFSSRMFKANSYQSLLGNVQSGEQFSKDITPISLEKIRVVDEDLANLLGDKVMGQQASLGSKSHIGNFTIQKVNNQLYWVAPLLHSGFFKWLNNLDGTDGYVMVSATNERDIKLVQEVNGKKVKIKYQPDSYFNYDLQRHVYTNGYITNGLTDFSFEIDDTGKPFWVITKYTNTIGYKGKEATGTLIVDAQTGEITSHDLNNTPNWVDRVQPSEFIQTQIDDWGELIKGYFNFSNEDKLKATENVKLVYGEDNNSYWYTGLTSVGADESTVGFMLVNTKTKQAKWYRQSGATENAAKKSAMGKVQEKGYDASSATPYNINNIPTYVMTLKDKGGLVKMFAMVAINDFTVVGVGNSLNECLTNFKNQYYQSSNKIEASSQTNQKELRAIVNRFQSDVKSGNTMYYFTLKGYPTIFVGSSQISNTIPLTQVGDSVQIFYDKDSLKILDVQRFTNLSLEK